MTNSTWTKEQIKEFSRSLRKRIGEGWKWLTPDVRRALVSAEVLAIVRAQAAESIKIDSVDALYTLMHEAMGTNE